MAVSEQDVRHVAALARLGLDEARVPALVAELNGILIHMDELRRVHTDGPAVGGVGAGGMPLRADDGTQYPLAHPRSEIAPEMRSGFYLVPRLATHAGLQASEGELADAELADSELDAADIVAPGVSESAATSSTDDAAAADAGAAGHRA